MVGIYFQPSTSDSVMAGSLTFGGYDKTKITGPLSWIPVTESSPADLYWGFDMTAGTAAPGDKTLMGLSSGILDTGACRDSACVFVSLT